MAEAAASRSYPIRRRQVLAAGVAGFGLVFAGRGEACSLTGIRRVPFDDDACRGRIRDWVALVNEGHDLSDDEIAARMETIDVYVDSDIAWDVLQERPPSPNLPPRFYREFRMASGRLDSRPVRISEVNRIRRVRNRATYQFTLDRYSFHPEDLDGCNGMFPPRAEYFGIERTAFLATFTNNEFDAIKYFPEWHLEEVA